MNNIKKGLQIEYEIINHINKNKYASKMNKNIRTFLEEIFNENLDNILITATKYCDNYKPDIVIKAGTKKVYISVKSGKDNSVHQEHIHSFCNFLSELNINSYIIDYLKLFHFNDGTINGSGSNKRDAFDFYKSNSNLCIEINKELNKIENKKQCLKRILFEGEYHNLPSVDYIYHGSYKKGIWASKEQILEYLLSKHLDTLSIHISKIYYQVWQRNLKNIEDSEFRRYFVQFKWHTIEQDLCKIKTK